MQTERIRNQTTNPPCILRNLLLVRIIAYETNIAGERHKALIRNIMLTVSNIVAKTRHRVSPR